MKGLLHAELTRLRKDSVFPIFIFAIAVISVFNFTLADMGRVSRYILMFGEETGRAHAFVFGMQDNMLPLWVAVLFPGAYIGFLFQNRGMSLDIMCGARRFPLLLLRIWEVQLISCVLFAIYPIVAVCFFGIPWLGTLDGAGWLYVLQAVGVKTLIDMGSLCTGIILGFAFRDFYRPPLVMVGIFLVFIIFRTVLGGFGMGDGEAIALYFLSPGAWGRSVIADPEATAAQLIRVVIPSLFFIILPVPVCWLLFRRADLK